MKLEDLKFDPKYKHDAALIERHQTADVLARRTRRMQEQCTPLLQALAGSNMPAWGFHELDQAVSSAEEFLTAAKQYYESPESQLRQAVQHWGRECFEHDNTVTTETTSLYRNFQSFATRHDCECCSRERFEQVASEMVGIRFRSRDDHLTALGRLKVTGEAA